MKNLLLLILLLNFTKSEAQTSAFPIADSLFNIGKYVEAISIYEKIEPATATVYLKIAQAYRAQGNFGKALTNYKLGVSKNAALPAAISEYGKLLLRTGKFKKADSIFQELTKRFPGNPDFHYQLGLAKEQLNDSTAIEYFRKTFSLDSAHQKAIYKLAVHNFQLKKCEKVELLGNKALETYSENSKIIGLLGQNAIVMRNYSLAGKRFEKLVSIDSDSEFAHEKLGFSYYHLDKRKKALEQYEIVINLNPQHVNAYYYSGRIYSLLGKTKKAEASLKKALLLKKRGLTGMYQALGNTYKQEKKYDKAIYYFKLALKENPYNLRAQYELTLVADRYYKDLETRLNYYKIFVDKFKTHPNAEPFLAVAEYRISELKKEKFMEHRKPTPKNK